MNILFQGGWSKNRDLPNEKELVDNFCLSFARHLLSEDHHVILTTLGEYDFLIANEIARLCKETGKNPKNYITFLLPEKISQIPEIGKVIKLPKCRWWLEERALLVQKADLLIAIGGGKGTAECIRRAFLDRKKVFVAPLTKTSKHSWYQRPSEYYYLNPNDAEFVKEVNISADEFFDKVFRIIAALKAVNYGRRVFVVHGRNHHIRDKLVQILKKMDFEPEVLEPESAKGLTIIEYLETISMTVDFCFVIYTPEDVGKITGGEEEPRARQNVIFEHGLLIGALGRNKVCALMCGNVTMP
ncbi:putative nucleotide-binding protein containing TIR-like domain [Methanomethylovorans hollandica DSM 15978]|uniref:Putative nucleotide-binding protein containing TIR-like domain n=1 Tax=Methanomethylovorans hollandica (strain DSM 15978 / NBRC 107637 / DMS1) TaxID=867904 RepID=L0KXH4_METHD|nr:nucleotide-binding protein [Methanomethylovorans hollandica]AGB49385.1 putative nucleotide-binding protein containing TIR-like domain [Methanomethylovorans hollandica DSM 15978]